MKTIDDKAREFAYTLIKWPDGSEQVAISPDSVTSYKAGYKQAIDDVRSWILAHIILFNGSHFIEEFDKEFGK